MITSLKYMPILVASVAMTSSFIFKIMLTELKLTSFIRDIIMFFILYYITKMLAHNVARIFKNYWKIL